MIEIPNRYKDAKPSDWEEGPIKKVVDKYIDNFKDYYSKGKAPCFLGKSGVGKSRAAAAILNVVQQYSTPSLSVAWFPASESLNRLLDYRDIRERDAYNSVFSKLKNTDVAVFDDIGTLRKSPRVLEYFWMIADARYSNLKPTIYTANFKFPENKDHWQVVADWFNVPFSRRLRETGEGLTIIF